jgi:hypothetical protein
MIITAYSGGLPKAGLGWGLGSTLLQLSLQLLIRLWWRLLIEDVQAITTDAPILAQKDENDLEAGIVFSHHPLDVIVARGPDDSVRHVCARRLAKQVGLARWWFLGLGHVDHDAAPALPAILLPGEGSSHGPVDPDELQVALPALRAGGEVFRSEFGHTLQPGC